MKNKNPAAPSVFQPAALLREARRQKKLPTVDVPGICILDPDVTSSVACDSTDERGHSTIAVSSGTTGLHLCTSAAGVGAGDEVITRGDGQPPPLTDSRGHEPEPTPLPPPSGWRPRLRDLFGSLPEYGFGLCL